VVGNLIKVKKSLPIQLRLELTLEISSKSFGVEDLLEPVLDAMETDYPQPPPSVYAIQHEFRTLRHSLSEDTLRRSIKSTDYRILPTIAPERGMLSTILQSCGLDGLMDSFGL
jgi:UV DNA damage repair endonuclease